MLPVVSEHRSVREPIHIWMTWILALLAPVISGGHCAALVSDFQSLVTVDTDVHERDMSSRVIKRRKETNFRGIPQPVVISAAPQNSVVFIEIPWRGVKFRGPRKI